MRDKNLECYVQAAPKKLAEKEQGFSVPSTSRPLMMAVSFCAGIYHGYFDGQGIAFDSRNSELALIYGPALVGGSIEGIKGGLEGMIWGGAGGAAIGASVSEKFSSALAAAGLGAAAGGAIVGGIKGTIGAATCGVITMLGYGAGYCFGYLTR